MNTRMLYRSISIVLLILCGMPKLGAQTISYILPDIGTPGMNTMIEIVAPFQAYRTFGTDGLYTNNPGDAVRVMCVDPSDTNRITVGPIVVSWDGRMVSAQIFVHPDQQPPSSYWYSVGPDFEIPLQVYANGTFGNAETFYIVLPQPAVITSMDGQIGSGGVWGLRSKRGAMIVDSLELTGAQYSISTIDPDTPAPGNQGFLPVVIISKGPIRTGASTVIHVNGSGKQAGPGGGGGGGNFCDWGGTGTDGGDGFTGGGPGGRNRAGNPFGSDEYRNPGVGSGAAVGRTGGSFNGLPGGDTPAFESSGGGSGHPFGNSGSGCADGSACNPPGGYGGGSGQQQLQNGGAGGYATPGQSSRNDNGGKVYGNRMIVPFAGGSGGASGNPQLVFGCSGDGGGGGGALRLYGRSVDAYLFTSHGGDGSSGSSANGGAGSGGAVAVEGKLQSGLWKITTRGGNGPGPAGGAGRIRMDGPIGWFSSGTPLEESLYFGPSTDTTMFVSRNFRLTGTGNGEPITLYIKSTRSPWSELAVISGYSGMAWSHDITLTDGDGVYFIAALQSDQSPSSERFLAVPSFVMSQAAANIIISTTLPRIAAEAPGMLPALRCENEVLDTIVVRNIGEAPLIITDSRFLIGGNGFSVLQPSVYPVQIGQNDSVLFVIRHQRIPGRTGVISDSLLIYSNDFNAQRNPLALHFERIVELAALAFDQSDVRLPDVLLCQTVFSDTVIAIRNTGTIPLTILAPAFSDTFVSLINPPLTSFPIVIQPGATADLSLRITHAASGTRSGTVTLTADGDGCNVEAMVRLTGTAGEAQLVLESVPEFPTLLCFGEQAAERTRLRNEGDVNVTITSISSDNTVWEILAPSTPIELAPASEIDILLRFNPLITGDHTGTLRVEAQPCDFVMTQPLRGRRDSIGVYADAVSFGLLHASEFPAYQYTTLHNTGTVPITMDQINIPAPFVLVTPLPLTIPPGDSLRVQLRFDDPGIDGFHSAIASSAPLPYCDSLRFGVIGERGEASLDIVVGTAEAAPGETVVLNIYLRNIRTPQLFGAASITSTLVMDASLLVPLFQNPGVVAGTERRIPISIPLVTDANGVALTLPFVATLGVSEATALTLDQTAVVGGALTFTETSGSFTLLGICREGGTRLFDGSVRAGIHSNRPNPFNPMTEIGYTTIEEVQTELFVLDLLGRRVATLYDGIPDPGRHDAVFDGSGLPSGLYLLVLRTHTQMYKHFMVLTK
jgi:hypothetical protein